MHELLAKRSEELNFMKFMNVLEKQINKAKKYMCKDFLFTILFKDDACRQLRRMLTGGTACTYCMLKYLCAWKLF